MSQRAGRMIVRVGNIAACCLVAAIVGMVVSAAVQAAAFPGVWSQPERLWDDALVAVVFYVAAPLAVLALVAMIGRTPSLAMSLLVAVGWITVIFARWAYKPWMFYGEFPWWGLHRHYLGMLPVSLSFGLAFAVCARKLLGASRHSSQIQQTPGSGVY